MGIKIGDKVGYSRGFLRSIGGDYDMAQARGIVTDIKPLGGRKLITVDWNSDMPPKVIEGNLAKVGSVKFCD